jgi:outer membrane protein
MVRGKPYAFALALLLAAPATPAQRLLQLCDAALQSSPHVKLREHEVERARAERDRVRSRLLPQLSAQAGWSRNEYDDALVDRRRYDGKRFGLAARMGVYDAPTRHRLGASDEAALQREQELVHTRMSLIAELVDVYLKGLQATDDLLTIDAEQAATQRQVDRLQAMLVRQMTKVTDLAETEAYAQSLVTRAIDARNQLELAQARLAELAGQPVATLVPLARQRFERVAGSADEAAAAALRSHPRLAALEHALESARKQLAGSSAEHLPQVALTGSHTYTDQGYDNRQLPPYHATSLGVEVRVPLYEGGRVDAATREALARVSSAEQQLEAARREIDRDTRANWARARANHARIDSTLLEVGAMEQTVLAQERGVELGASRVIDLLDARRRLIKARGDHAKARYDFVRDVVNLKASSGELTLAAIAVWDRWFDAAPR